jgi:hypothetical protein
VDIGYPNTKSIDTLALLNIMLITLAAVPLNVIVLAVNAPDVVVPTITLLADKFPVTALNENLPVVIFAV